MVFSVYPDNCSDKMKHCAFDEMEKSALMRREKVSVVCAIEARDRQKVLAVT